MRIDYITHKLFYLGQNLLNNLLMKNGLNSQDLSSQILDDSVFYSLITYL